MIDVEGDFDGEVVLNPIKYSKILTKVVIKNNDTSGKVIVPAEYISEKVVVLFPKKKSSKPDKSD